MSDELLGVLIAGWAISGIICGGLSDTVAKSEGYKNSSWFLAGLFFGILGLIAAAGLGPNMGAVLQTAAVRDSNESVQPVEPVTISHNKKVANRIIFIVLALILLAVLVFALKPF